MLSILLLCMLLYELCGILLDYYQADCVSAKYQEIRQRELSEIGVTNRWNPLPQVVPGKTT